MIVTIDGPAGAGKSTAARALARRLGFRFLDTGAMYRAVAWAAIERGLPWDQPQALVDLARALKIELRGDRAFCRRPGCNLGNPHFGGDRGHALCRQQPRCPPASGRAAASNRRSRQHRHRRTRPGDRRVSRGRAQGLPHGQSGRAGTAAHARFSRPWRGAKLGRRARASKPDGTAATSRVRSVRSNRPTMPWSCRPMGYRPTRWSIDWKRWCASECPRPAFHRSEAQGIPSLGFERIKDPRLRPT